MPRRRPVAPVSALFLLCVLPFLMEASFEPSLTVGKGDLIEVAVSRTENRLAFASEHSIGVYTVPEFEPIWTRANTSPFLHGIAISGDGESVITADDNAVDYWDAENGDFLGNRVFPEYYSVRLPRASPVVPVMSVVAIDHPNARQRDSIVFFSTVDGQILKTIALPDSVLVRRCEFSPDGTRFAFWTDHNVQVVDTATWAIDYVIGQSNVVSLVFTPDGQSIFTTRQPSSSGTGSIKQWDANTGAWVATLSLGDHPSTMSMSADGARIAIADWRVCQIYSTESGTLEGSLDSLPAFTVATPTGSASGHFILQDVQGNLIFVPDDAPAESVVVSASTPALDELIPLDAGRTLAGRTTFSGPFHMWNSESGRALEPFHWLYKNLYPLGQNARAIDASSDGRFLALDGTSNQLVVIDRDGDEIVFDVVIEPGSRIEAIRLSSDMTTISAVDLGNHRFLRWDMTSGELINELAIDPDITHVRGTSISPDGAYFVASVDDSTLVEGSTRLYAAESGETFELQKTASTMGAPVSWQDNETFALAPYYTDKNLVQILSMASGEPKTLTTFPIDGYWLLNTIAISPDGFFIAASGRAYPPTIHLMTRGGAAVTTLTYHTGVVEGLRFSRDGRFLYSASADGTGAVWDIHTLTGPPRMLSSEGSQQLVFPVFPGLQYRIKESTDLKTWTDVNFGPTGSANPISLPFEIPQFPVTLPDASDRFYRIDLE